MLERTYLVIEPRSLQYLFVLAYIEIYVFRGNSFQAYSLEQNEKYKRTNNTQLI